MANFRNGDAPGPDYKCKGCGLTGHRLWRMSASSCVELLCAVCAEVDQAEQIARYASHHEERSTQIGNLVPARRDPDDLRWWGHSSGDVGWWYRMPQYQDEKREAALVRRERDEFQRQSDHYASSYLQALQAKRDLEQKHATS